MIVLTVEYVEEVLKVTSAKIVEVGPRGPRGFTGPTGDVTPEAQQARDEAVGAATTAQGAAGVATDAAAAAGVATDAAEQARDTAQGHAADADTSATAAAISAAQAAGNARNYLTRAQLPAATSVTEGTAVEVNNDPNPDNNGRWASFGGVWVQSADRVTGLESSVAAIGGEILDRSSGLLEATMGVLNLLNPAAITPGSLITNGVVSANAGYWTTGFMPVESGGTVTSNTTQTGLTGSRAFNFFDKNKNFISALAAPIVAGTAYSVPANAHWVRTCYPNTAPASGVMIVSGSALPADFIPFGMPRKVWARSHALDAAARPFRLNLYDKPLITPGYLVRPADGSLEANANYFVTNYLPVTPGGTFTIGLASVSLTAPRGLVFYDIDKNPMGGVLAPFAANQVVPVPSRAHYARVSVHNSQLDTFVALEGEQTSGHIATHTLALKADTLPWHGRKFAILGDSISANTNWMATMTAQLGASVGLNATLSGRRMVDALKTPAGVDLTAADFDNIDAAVLFLGTNDITITPLGTIADATTDATFYGQTKKVVETLLTWKPTLRLVIATLLYRTSNNANLDAFAQALREVAHHYSVPVLDFRRTSGINPVTASTFLYDGLHPNALGYSACLVPTAAGFFANVLPRA